MICLLWKRVAGAWKSSWLAMLLALRHTHVVICTVIDHELFDEVM
jgi:hypothetical protein